MRNRVLILASRPCRKGRLVWKTMPPGTIVSGFLNKQAAAELGISEVTLQIHRSRIMQKMAAASFADLVRMAGQLNIALERRKQQ